jgi:uncharacterized membrane protein
MPWLDLFLVFLGFTLFHTAVAFCIYPCAESVVRGSSVAPEKQIFASVALAPALGIAFFLVFFSLFARVIPSYLFTANAVFLCLALVSVLVRRQEAIAAWRGTRQQWKFFALLPLLHLLFWIPRFFFSDIHFDPNLYGAEKLFNLSLQQSFSFDSSYPPQSLWLAGEPEAYYILPRIIPGLMTHLSNQFSLLDFRSAGIFFHLSDTFYNALAVLTLMGAAHFFLESRQGTPLVRWVLALSVGLFPFLAVPARAVIQAFQSAIDFWSLSRIIPYTINEYPFWNYLFADNHAHSNAAFLDVVVHWLMLLVVFRATEFSRDVQFRLGIVLGVCASALFMAQSSSVLVVVVVFLLPWVVKAIDSLRKGQLNAFVRTSLWAAGSAFLLSVPDILSRPQPKVLWHWVPPRLATRFLDFLNVNLSLLVFALVFIVAGLSKSRFLALRAHVRFFPTFIILSLTPWALGYPAVTAAIVLATMIAWVMVDFSRPDWIHAVALIAGFTMIFVFHEWIAANFNMGPNNIRLNMVFKFQYTSFFVWPLLIMFVWTLKPSAVSGQRRVVSRLSLVVFFVGVSVFAHSATMRNRLEIPHSQGGVSGFEFLEKARRVDFDIVRFVHGLASRVVLVEECGMPPKSAAYSEAGRISAYSGRAALCGWGMHSFIHLDIFKAEKRQGKAVWQYLTEVNESITKVYSVGDANDPESLRQAQGAVARLVGEGATHLVFGEFEKKIHSKTSLQALELATQGRIVFQKDGFGVIVLPASHEILP